MQQHRSLRSRDNQSSSDKLPTAKRQTSTASSRKKDTKKKPQSEKPIGIQEEQNKSEVMWSLWISGVEKHL